MQKTGIEYLTHTWNPIAMRCTPISPGCANCWHLTVADRLANNPKIPPETRKTYAGESKICIVRKRLGEPERCKSPSFIGVQFMGDLFHETITFQIIDMVYAEMENAPWHTYIVLTKRPKRMLEYYKHCEANGYGKPDNIWIGCTAETQKTADERIPILLYIPAAVRFVSVEPCLSNINLFHRNMLDWVICGCESGSKRRTTDINWIRNLRDQCVDFNIPFFLKQIEINGKVVKMPTIDGKVGNQYPK